MPEVNQAISHDATILSGDRRIIDQFVDEWTALCNEGPCSWITFRPEWVNSYLDAYHPAGRYHVLIIRNNGSLRGFLPMVETRIGIGSISIRRIRVAANFFSWEFDLIHGLGDRDAVVAVAMEALDSWYGWDILACEVALAEGVFPELARSLQGHGASAPSPAEMTGWIIPCPPPESTFEDTITLIARERQRQLRRHLKKAATLGELEWSTLTTDAEESELLTALEEFIVLEASGWKGRTGDPVRDDETIAMFYRNLIRQKLVYIHRLHVGGKLLASNFGVKYGSRFFSIRFAYHEEFAEVSPGHLMTIYTLVDMAKRGCVDMDCGGTHVGVETYKTTWTDRSYSIASYMVFRKGIRGRVVQVAWNKLLPRVESRLRKITRR